MRTSGGRPGRGQNSAPRCPPAVPCAGGPAPSGAGGDRGYHRLRDVPGVHEQRAGDLADLWALRDQHRLAVTPGGELVRAEAAADTRAITLRVAAVAPPSRQPGA